MKFAVQRSFTAAQDDIFYFRRRECLQVLFCPISITFVQTNRKISMHQSMLFCEIFSTVYTESTWKICANIIFGNPFMSFCYKIKNPLEKILYNMVL